MCAIINIEVLLLGILILLARVIDVSLGTLRIISTVNGRMKLSFLFGFVEIVIWITVISTVIDKVKAQPILAIFYALGFSTGNVLGIYIERKLAMGLVALRIFSLKEGERMADNIRKAGFAVTAFQGKGRSGTITELYLVCRTKDVGKILHIANGIEPESFFSIEQAKQVNKLNGTFFNSPLGLRTIVKKR